MQGGFSFCGVDIAELGLEYAPDNVNTYVFKPSDYKLSEQIFDAHDGGYYYGETVQPKIFTLRCIYQDEHVNGGIISNVSRFFRRGRTGRLVFQKRPWVWYGATVVNVNVSQMLNYMNGLVTITLKAYYPFGRTDMEGYEEGYEYLEALKSNSAMLPSGVMPETKVIEDGQELTTQTIVPLLNAGTERASVAIEIAGDVGEGVLINNPSTGQSCRFVAMSKAATTNAGKYVVCDGLNGKTVLTDGTDSELSYLYHDYGFIDLEPAYPIIRDVSVSYTSGSALVRAEEDVFGEDSKGKYLYYDGAWRKIASVVNSKEANVLPSPSVSGSEKTNIVQMNELVVTPVASMSLTRLNFVYKHTFE